MLKPVQLLGGSSPVSSRRDARRSSPGQVADNHNLFRVSGHMELGGGRGRERGERETSGSTRALPSTPPHTPGYIGGGDHVGFSQSPAGLPRQSCGQS